MWLGFTLLLCPERIWKNNCEHKGHSKRNIKKNVCDRCKFFSLYYIHMLPAFYKISFQSKNLSPPKVFIDFLPKEVTSSIFPGQGGGRLSRVGGWLSWKSCQPEEEKELWVRLQVLQGGTHPFIRGAHLQIHPWQKPALSEPTIQSTSPPAPELCSPLHPFHLSQSSHLLWLKPTLLPETTTSSRVPEIHPFMSAGNCKNISHHTREPPDDSIVLVYWGLHHEDVCLRFNCCC